MVGASRSLPANCYGKISLCYRCKIQYCHNCYFQCPKCNYAPEIFKAQIKKCEVFGCKNEGQVGFNIAPGTYVFVCSVCLARETERNENDLKEIEMKKFEKR